MTDEQKQRHRKNTTNKQKQYKKIKLTNKSKNNRLSKSI